MFGLLYAFVVLTVRFARADGPLWPQTGWLAPAPPDGSTTVTAGVSYRIRWTSDLYTAFANYLPSADPTSAALWVTTSAGNQDPILLQSSVNVQDTTSFTWNVSIPSAQLANNGVWTLKFIPANVASPAATEEQVSSPWFVVREAAAAASTSTASSVSSSTTSAKLTTSTSTTASSTSTTAPSTSTTGSSTPALSASRSSSSGLSGGAIGGIVIGAIAVVIMAVGVYFLLYKKRGRSAPRSGLATDDGHGMTDFKNQPPYYPQQNGSYPTSAVQSQSHPSYPTSAVQSQSQPSYVQASELDGSR